VSFFNDAKGFGFATDAKGDDLFIHFSSIQGDGFKSLAQGQKITFEEAQGPKGREAKNVRPVGASSRGAGRGAPREGNRGPARERRY
jgi:CspA family cold shock protein